MEEREWLVDRFEENRTHLRAVAYRMLGSTGETDDAMQEPLEEPDVRVPDPIVGREDRIDPEHEALLADSVGRRS